MSSRFDTRRERRSGAGVGGRGMQRLILLLPLLLLHLTLPSDTVHYPDNGDGTYSNPVMPNAHWSDPSVVRVGNLYYCVTSSIETTPSMQILESADLVHWDVVGSVSRLWVDCDPSTGQAISPSACWSPRIMFLRGKFRVMWTQAMHHFLIAEAVDVRGPWTLVKHNLTAMSDYVFGASTFVDTTGDGKTYLLANNWIQQTDVDGLSFVGPRHFVANSSTAGIGMMENPSLIKRGNWYWWLESDNGTVTWGLAPDPNGGPLSTNNGALSAWRSRTITGPYEGPHHVVMSNVDFTCVNTGTAVLGPDNVTFYYLYNAIEARRWSLQRQLMLDKIEFNTDSDPDAWPTVITPSRRRPFPANAPALTRPVWRPQLSDEFNSSQLEGVTGGVVGRKWLFKQENPNLWSLRDDGLTLKTGCVGIESDRPANLLLQRPTSSYFTIETKLTWVGGCGGNTSSNASGHAGLIARELTSGSSVAIGVFCDAGAGGLRLAMWQDTLNLIWISPTTFLDSEPLFFKLNVDLVRAQGWWSHTGTPQSWKGMFAGGTRTNHYTGTRLVWEEVHAGPGRNQFPSDGKPAGGGGEGGRTSTANFWRQADSFTTMHPGLFAGGGTSMTNAAHFDYWRYTDHEVFAS